MIVRDSRSGRRKVGYSSVSVFAVSHTRSNFEKLSSLCKVLLRDIRPPEGLEQRDKQPFASKHSVSEQAPSVMFVPKSHNIIVDRRLVRRLCQVTAVGGQMLSQAKSSRHVLGMIGVSVLSSSLTVQSLTERRTKKLTALGNENHSLITPLSYSARPRLTGPVCHCAQNPASQCCLTEDGVGSLN